MSGWSTGKPRREAWLADRQCVMCGCTSNLEVDHIDPSKKTMRAAQIWMRTEHVRTLELLNCQALCHDCHVSKSRYEGSFSRNTLKTECPRQHPYTPENTRTQLRNDSEMRSCKQCHRDRKRKT